MCSSDLVDNAKVYNVKKSLDDDLRAVVVIPDRTMSTKHSRNILPKKYSSKDCIYNISRSSTMVGIFMEKRWDMLRLASQDRFHQQKRMSSFPVLFGVQDCALSNGALMSTLSGSGSSFFSLCFRDDAKRIREALEKKFNRFRVLELGFDNIGIREKD